jgi:hypothetical protein
MTVDLWACAPHHKQNFLHLQISRNSIWGAFINFPLLISSYFTVSLVNPKMYLWSTLFPVTIWKCTCVGWKQIFSDDCNSHYKKVLLYYSGTCLEELKEISETFSVADFQAGFWIHDLFNTNQNANHYTGISNVW